jgi:site-specific recombinase XerD
VTADPHRPRVVGPDHAPVPAINDFLSYLEHRACSPYTVRAYARGLAHFAGWLHEAGVDLDAVTRPVVGQYTGAFGQGPRRHACLIDRPSPNEGRQARTVNLSVLASYFAFRIRPDDDRCDGARPTHRPRRAAFFRRVEFALPFW